MSIRLGLTGSIGMGKSTTAKLFAQAGCAVWDADAAVHRLYGPGGAAVPFIATAFPEAIVDDMVSRPLLKDIISKDPTALQRIEEIVHPLVAKDRADFTAKAQADVLVFDIPLLFETGADAQMDVTVTVTVDPDIQQSRVLSRGTMTQAQFEQIKAKQIPDAEKRERADFVIVTDTLDHAREQVDDVLKQIKGQAHARDRS